MKSELGVQTSFVATTVISYIGKTTMCRK